MYINLEIYCRFFRKIKLSFFIVSEIFPCASMRRIENRKRWCKSKTREKEREEEKTGAYFPVGTIRISRINYCCKSIAFTLVLHAEQLRESRRFLMEPIKYCTAVCYNTSYACLRSSPSIYRHLRVLPHQRFSFHCFDDDFNIAIF